MSSPSRKRGRGSSGRFHLVVFVYGVNQENKETGGVHKMVESFSTNLLPALKSYWAELHLEFCQT